MQAQPLPLILFDCKKSRKLRDVPRVPQAERGQGWPRPGTAPPLLPARLLHDSTQTAP